MSTLNVIHPIDGNFDPGLLWQDAVTRYVSKNGNDANNGETIYSPMLTIQVAIDALAVAGTVPAGSFGLVRIAAGQYAEDVVLKRCITGGVSNAILLQGNSGTNTEITGSGGAAPALSLDPTLAAPLDTGLLWAIDSLSTVVSVAGSQSVDLSDPTLPGLGIGLGVTFNECFFRKAGGGVGDTNNVNVNLGETGICGFSDCLARASNGGVARLDNLTLTDTGIISQNSLWEGQSDLGGRSINVLTELASFFLQDDHISHLGAGTGYAIDVFAGFVLVAGGLCEADNGLCVKVADNGLGDAADFVGINTLIQTRGTPGVGDYLVLCDGPNSTFALQNASLQAGTGFGSGINVLDQAFVSVLGGSLQVPRECVTVSGVGIGGGGFESFFLAQGAIFQSIDNGPVAPGGTPTIDVVGNGTAHDGKASCRITGPSFINFFNGAGGAAVPISVAAGGFLIAESLQIQRAGPPVTPNDIAVASDSDIDIGNVGWTLGGPGVDALLYTPGGTGINSLNRAQQVGLSVCKLVDEVVIAGTTTLQLLGDVGPSGVIMGFGLVVKTVDIQFDVGPVAGAAPPVDLHYLKITDEDTVGGPLSVYAAIIAIGPGGGFLQIAPFSTVAPPAAVIPTDFFVNPGHILHVEYVLVNPAGGNTTGIGTFIFLPS